MKTILTLNGGSSSLKAAVFPLELLTEQPLLHAHISGIGYTPAIHITLARTEQTYSETLNLSETSPYEHGLIIIRDHIEKYLPDSVIHSIGHRVVHGGKLKQQAHAFSEQVADYLTSLTPLAPLHQGANLALYRASQTIWPHSHQWACCDTVFHCHQPKIEQAYAIPDTWFQKGIRRYGFHGLSYGYITKQLNSIGRDDKKTIVAHLGSGASLCALQNGLSIAATMGFSATDGIPMATRSGAIDPGVLLYLERHHQMTTSEIETLLNKQSGLLGLSGISGDIRTLHTSTDPKAAFAIELFCYRIASEIARLSSTLQGIEQLVFTAGIGEKDSQVRAAIVKRCEWLGMSLDTQANARNASVISQKSSRIVIRVIPTNEEAFIAQAVVHASKH